MTEADALARPTVRISPVMRALFARSRAGGGDAAADVPASQAAPPPAAPAQAPPVFGTVLLRRHGARPLRFRGAEVARCDTAPGKAGLRFSFALYVDELGGVYGALAARADDDGSAAEMHAAARLDEAEALSSLIDSLSPELAIPDPAAAPAKIAESFADARWAARQDYETFSASLRRVAPPAEPRTRT